MGNPVPQLSDHLQVRVHPVSHVVPSLTWLIVREHAKHLRFPNLGVVAGSEHMLPKCEFELGDHFAGSSVNGAHILEIAAWAIAGSGEPLGEAGLKSWVPRPIRAVDRLDRLRSRIPDNNLADV